MLTLLRLLQRRQPQEMGGEQLLRARDAPDGHNQGRTSKKAHDNTTALGIVNNNVMKKLKAMDMKYHWL